MSKQLSAAPTVSSAPPLAVDLDGTLIQSDTLHEGFLACLHRAPEAVGELGRALRRSKAAFKRAVTERVEFDPKLLPYNEEMLAYLREQREAGRVIGLFTAADQGIADAVARHLGLFDLARGSDGVTNLSGAEKARAIRREFGDHFVYAGDSPVDAPVFEQAQRVVLVGPVERLQAALPAGKPVEAAFPVRRAGLSIWARALRVKHWTKNLLVFVAPVLGFHFSAEVIGSSLLMFMSLSLLASATYLLNDLVDLAADRAHPKKQHRPLAAGLIPARDGVLAAFGMIAASLGLGLLLLPVSGLLALHAYLAITLAYSFALKRQAFVDVVVLAGLFTLRVLAGAALVPAPISPWLLTFSMLFFLGLAMIKRCAELERVLGDGGNAVSSRGYTVRDLPLLLAAGVASGFTAIAVFTIYLINDQYPRDVYGHPELLWAMVPVILLWLLRMWHLTVHRRMDEDPVVFALRDRMSLALGGAVGLILLAAWS